VPIHRAHRRAADYGEEDGLAHRPVDRWHRRKMRPQAVDPSRTTEAGHPHPSNGAAAPWSRGARPPRVHQHGPPRAELKKCGRRPVASSTSRARGAPDGARGRARSPGPGTKGVGFGNSMTGCGDAPNAVETRSEFRYEISAPSCPSLTVRP
jgi:hypothetical protein